MVHAVDNTVRDQVVELAERVLSIVATMGRRGTEVTARIVLSSAPIGAAAAPVLNSNRYLGARPVVLLY